MKSFKQVIILCCIGLFLSGNSSKVVASNLFEDALGYCLHNKCLIVGGTVLTVASVYFMASELTSNSYEADRYAAYAANPLYSLSNSSMCHPGYSQNSHEDEVIRHTVDCLSSAYRTVANNFLSKAGDLSPVLECIRQYMCEYCFLQPRCERADINDSSLRFSCISSTHMSKVISQCLDNKDLK
jgi:hypothetical protein